MHAQITIHAAPAQVFAWLSAPGNARHWFAHLRHDADGLPDPGLSSEEGAMTVRWSGAPAGSMVLSGVGEATSVELTFEEGDHAPEAPAEEESPDDAPTNAGNALRSIKSHVEAAEGGDPDLHLPGVVSREQVEEAGRDLTKEAGRG